MAALLGVIDGVTFQVQTPEHLRRWGPSYTSVVLRQLVRETNLPKDKAFLWLAMRIRGDYSRYGRTGRDDAILSFRLIFLQYLRLEEERERSDNSI